jgi:hypothetical protein
MKYPKNLVLYLAIVASLLMVLYAQFIFGHYSQCFRKENSINSLGLTFGYSTADVMAFVESRSKQQLNCYIDFLSIWDSIFPLLYTLMNSLWIIYLLKKRFFLIIIPLIQMFCDWTENYMEVSIINNYLNSGIISEHLISYGSYITILKWTLSILTYTIIIFGIIVKIKHSLTKVFNRSN